MESLAEIKRRAHKPQVNYTSPWYARRVIRHISIYFTWMLVATPITANQITLAGLVVGIAGIVFLSNPVTSLALMGVLLLHLSYIFDCVDGEVARYKGQQSVNGMFLDFLSHEVVIPMTYCGLSLHYYFKENELIFLIIGITSIICMLNPIGKSRQTTINYFFEKRKSPVYDIRNYNPDLNRQKGILNSEKNPDSYEMKMGRSRDESTGCSILIVLLSRVRRQLNQLLAYPNDIIIILIIIVIELLTGSSIFGRWFILAFVLYQVFNQIAGIYVHLSRRVVEQDLWKYIKIGSELYDQRKR